MAIAGRVVIEPNRDIAVVDPYFSWFSISTSVGGLGLLKRPGVFGLLNAVFLVEAKLIVNRYPIVGVVEVSDHNALVVKSGQLGLESWVLRGRRKVHRLKRAVRRQQESLVGSPMFPLP